VTVVFWVLAPVMVLAAIGMVLVRKAVHSALLLAVVMVSLAALYAGLDAPFLFAVQIIVYTGAILMLFLFVVMLVGVDASDSVVETIRGQRLAAIVVGLLFAAVLAYRGGPGGHRQRGGAGRGERRRQRARAGPAAVRALHPRLRGHQRPAHHRRARSHGAGSPGAVDAEDDPALAAEQRMRDYRDHGKPLGPLPVPGVYARHNAVDTPALLPDGSPSELSISRSLRARGNVRRIEPDKVERTAAAIDPQVPASDISERGSGR
jgi:NADH-quinone oxidoreductase subunit J